MYQIEDICVKPTATIKEVLGIIDKSSKQIALITNEDRRLLGTVSDGDIRRGLLKGLTLEDSVETIYCSAPTTAHINDSKESILRKAVINKLHQIPIVDTAGMLLGLEEIEELVRPTTYPNKVVLMAGGLGTRLRPLTDDIPKPLLKVGNKPILETIIENFAKYGFTNIILSVNYKAEMLEQHFGDGSKYGVSIEYVHESKRMGTAGPLSLMEGRFNEPFFVMNGDLLTNVNFEHMLDYHLVNNSVATMGVREYDFQVPYGVVNLEDNKVQSIVEKPIQKFFVSGGIYILDHKTLRHIPKGQFYDMPTLFETLIGNDENVISFPIREYWLDIGRLSDFEQAQSDYSEVFSAEE